MSDHAELEFGGPLPRAAYHALLSLLVRGPDVDLGLIYMIKDGHHFDQPDSKLGEAEARGWWNMKMTEQGIEREPIRLAILADGGEGEEYDPAYFDQLVALLQVHRCVIRRKVPIYIDQYQYGGPQGGTVTLDGPGLAYQGSASIDADDDPAIEIDDDSARDPVRLATSAIRTWFIVNYPIPPLTLVEDGSAVETAEPEAADA
jgi:hypothetical protein